MKAKHDCSKEMQRKIKEFPLPLQVFRCSCGEMYIYSCYCKESKDYMGYTWQKMGDRD